MYFLGVESSRFFPFLQFITIPKNRVHPGSGNFACLSIPPIHYNAPQKYMYHVPSISGKVTFFFSLFLQNINYNVQKLHTCPFWKWKVHVSFHSSSILQCQKIAYMYILEVESSRFFPFLQFITMTKNHMQVHPGSGNFTFLSIPRIHYNAQKSHTCTSWKWKAHASWQHINNNAQNHIHASTSWEWKVRVSLHSSNTLQCQKTAYMYILEVES